MQPPLCVPKGEPHVRKQHQFVRLEEQTQCELILRTGRCVWLIADWGTGKERFVAASLHRFRKNDSGINAFHLRCDEAVDVESLQALFPQQFGMPLQAFCAIGAAVNNGFLMLDELHPTLCTGLNLRRLQQNVDAILDYCPSLYVILSSRLTPDDSAIRPVCLHPLDEPDVRSYICKPHGRHRGASKNGSEQESDRLVPPPVSIFSLKNEPGRAVRRRVSFLFFVLQDFDRPPGRPTGGCAEPQGGIALAPFSLS